MINKISLHTGVFLTLLVLLSGISCTRQEQIGDGDGVTFTLSSGLPQTRGIAEIQDGTEIYFDGSTPDLVLLLFDSNGALVAKYPDPGHSEVLDTPAPTAVDLRIRIARKLNGERFSSGTYSLYAMANTGGFWHLSGDPVIGNISTKAQADALFFDARPTSLIADRMPLTAIGTVDVNDGGNGVAEVNLLRPVGKVVVRFVNKYGGALTLAPYVNPLDPTEIRPLFSINEVNPDKGYLFPHDTDSPTGVTKETVSQAIASSIVLPDNTNPDNDVYEISSLVYPGTGNFVCDFAFTITQVGGNPITAQPFKFLGLPILDKRGVDINSISRNQQLTVTVNISQGTMLSFSFEVGDWKKLTEPVTFD